MIIKIYECPLYERNGESPLCTHYQEQIYYMQHLDIEPEIAKGCVLGRQICHISIDTDKCKLDYKEIFDQLIRNNKRISDREKDDLTKIFLLNDVES